MMSMCVDRVLIIIAVLLMAPCGLIADDGGGALRWRIGVEAEPAWMPPTNLYFKNHGVSESLAGALKADFCFDDGSRIGRTYPGLYHGVGVGGRCFSSGAGMGAPVSAFIYQGAPFARLGRRVTVGYEWQFGAAFGWRGGRPDINPAVSTCVTAHMGVGVRMHYSLTRAWQLTAGVQFTHFSNGNTSYPNAGVNSLGVTIGAAYRIGSGSDGVGGGAASSDGDAESEADRRRWHYDVVVYGAWRKRALMLGGSPQLCPGRFGVAGLQFAPLYCLNRYVGVGPSLDVQYNESSGLARYWVEGTVGDRLKFYRPPFARQLSVGLSAHAELTMPLFAVNVGMGYDVVSPDGERRFYQSLTLKAFVWRHLFLNVGYRLGRFQDPQNLMLGVGVRI
ncbi:MAG: acyloxyacyl hydrolase [Muribaculaceae bacterium]|nr:acyloxyacyl hydrolase [Muribaculaceae bacterium]